MQKRAERIVKVYGETDESPEKRLADEDKRRKADSALRDRADALIFRGESLAGKLSREDAGRIEKPLKEVKKLKDGKNPAKLKDACDRLEEMLNYADKADGAYDTKFTK